MCLQISQAQVSTATEVMSIQFSDSLPTAMSGGESVDVRSRPPVLLLAGIGLTAAVALRVAAPLEERFRVLPTTLGAVADDRSAGGARSDHRRRCGGPARRRRRRAGSRRRPFVRLSDRSGDRDPASGTCPFARARLVHGRRQTVRRTGTADPPVPVAAAGPAGRGGSVGDRAVSLRGHHAPPARAADRRGHRAAL